MEYVGKLGRVLVTVNQFYREINPATLSGAIDVIVVEQPDGELACSPFHVRFGKLSVLRPQEKKVEIKMNGEIIDFPMKIGDSGEAFFVYETEEDLPEEFLTSPIASPVVSPSAAEQPEPPFLDLSVSDAKVLEGENEGDGYVSANSTSGSEGEGESPREAVSNRVKNTKKKGNNTQNGPSMAEAVMAKLSKEKENKESPEQQEHSVDAVQDNKHEKDEVKESKPPVIDATGYKTDVEAQAEEAEANKPSTKSELDLLASGGKVDVLAHKHSHHHRFTDEFAPVAVPSAPFHSHEAPETPDHTPISTEVPTPARLRERSKSWPPQYSNAPLSTLTRDEKILTHENVKPQPSTSTQRKINYAKTLRLTSDQLKSLKLKKGVNTISFTVSSSYYGKATCVSKLFFWDHDTQIIISDIDGTITKSDALGHLFTMVGKDWTHTGVAKLYTHIHQNGYQILYLTSRAIGQADYTRDYLKKVEQNNYQLPDGPVIMSPDRLLTAFHREVIMRKPELFKMACLRDIQRLFSDRNPFFAGFGNRITDALSYRSVDIPASRIFTIDPNGQVVLELLTSAGYKSSYMDLSQLVDQLFPPVHQKLNNDFTDLNWWKAPLPDIELPEPESPASSPGVGPVDATPGGGTRSMLRSLTSIASNSRKRTLPSSRSETSLGLATSPLLKNRASEASLSKAVQENQLKEKEKEKDNELSRSPPTSSSRSSPRSLSPSLLSSLVTLSIRDRWSGKTEKDDKDKANEEEDGGDVEENGEEVKGGHSSEDDVFDFDEEEFKTPFDLDKIPFL
ncbi:uncharacterized protein VTP21DRAFT_11447 [Calcarisporiella thermophila]|uniref:uncharacterized protein n=1 Tax=Calcarisporiella thermophila TaxID=911321 RepID=UPI003743102C